MTPDQHLVQDLNAIYESLRPKMWDRTIACNPADEAVISEGLEQMVETHGHFRVRATTLVPKGTAYVMDDEKIELPIWDAAAWREGLV